MDLMINKLNELRELAERWLRRAAERFRTLRFQVLGIVVLSVLIPSFLAGWLASTRISDILRQQVFREIESKTEKIAESVSDWIDSRSSDIRDFALTSILLQEEVKALVGKMSPEEQTVSIKNVKRYLTYLLEDNQHFDAISIVSPDGSILAEHPPGVKIADSRDTSDIIDTSPVVMEVTINDKSRLAIAQPMNLKGERGSAAFIARTKENLLKEVILESAPAGSTVYLVDQEGNIKVSNVDLKGRQTAPGAALALFSEKATHSIYKGIEGEEVIAKVVPLTFLQWGVILETSREKAFQPLSTFRFQMIFMALALASIFLVPAVLLARTIVLPLEELSRVSKRIRTGKPGLQVESTIKGELGEFIATFNSMSISLKESLEEINATNEQLRIISITDSLTGRYNRRYIKDYLTRELQLVSRTRHSLTVLMMDLDNFKRYNDTYGHIAGDEALRQLGDILVGSVRKNDVVGRYGGEEWIICFNQTDKETGLKIAEKLRKAIAGNIFHLKGENTRITVSAGVATAPADGTNYEELIDAADAALYMAKESGRNCVRAFTGPDSSESTPPDRKQS
jgi:diguanylate cyclase (GGDEF)-like protein